MTILSKVEDGAVSELAVTALTVLIQEDGCSPGLEAVFVSILVIGYSSF